MSELFWIFCPVKQAKQAIRGIHASFVNDKTFVKWQDIVRARFMSPNRLSNLTIVVVEDHDDVRTYLGVFLGHLGANVIMARDAFEGFEAIKNNHPNLVLADIVMPGMNGFELLREIRALGADAGGGVAVIAMSALFTEADRARILNAGFQACLPKPFAPDKLLETIVALCGD